MIGVAYTFFGIFFLGTCIAAYFLINFYQDKNEAEPVPTITSIVALICTVTSLLIIPLDIYSVSLGSDTIDENQSAIKTLYYVFFIFSLIMSFILIPFAYFYYEEIDEDRTTAQRAAAALKYVSCTIIILVVLLIIGLVIKNPSTSSKTESGQQKYAQKLADESTHGDTAIQLIVCFMAALGLLTMFTYTANGLSVMPITMIRGYQSIRAAQRDVEADLEANRAQQLAISSKYSLKTKKAKYSRKDRMQITRLQSQERKLQRQTTSLTVSNSRWGRLKEKLRPFFWIVGIFLILVSILIILSLLLTTINRSLYSPCHEECGYAVDKPGFNPLDTIFLGLAMAFPLDYFFMALIIIYFLHATIYGMRSLSIRFLWVKMYDIRKGRTVPQGILFLALLLMYVVVALTVEFLSFTPQYALFGSQNGGSCTIADAHSGKCRMTIIGQFFTSATLKMPFFGVVFYFFQWLFILSFIIFCIYGIFRKQKGPLEDFDDSSDSDDPDSSFL